MNVCKTLWNNIYFWVILIFELIVQHFMLIQMICVADYDVVYQSRRVERQVSL